MKKKYLKTVEDIKYCEENGIELYDEYQATVCFRFVDGVWCSYTNKNLNVYNVRLSLNSLYYEEESEEPMQEATEDDVGKLCWFWDDEERDGERSILKAIYGKENYPYLTEDCNSYVHCRRLFPAEVAEITGYGVSEDGSKFYGEPFKVVGKEKND